MAKRDFSSILSTASHLFAEGEIETARKFWSKARNALADHEGLGEPSSYLFPACYLKEFYEAVAASDFPIEAILVSNRAQHLGWLDWPKACERIASHHPAFLANLLTHGVSEESQFPYGLGDEDDENWNIKLDYIPVAMRKDVERACDLYLNSDGNDWARRLMNAAVAMQNQGNMSLVKSHAEATEWLHSVNADADQVQKFEQIIMAQNSSCLKQVLT